VAGGPLLLARLVVCPEPGCGKSFETLSRRFVRCPECRRKFRLERMKLARQRQRRREQKARSTKKRVVVAERQARAVRSEVVLTQHGLAIRLMTHN
jgi:hypothetical protein